MEHAAARIQQGLTHEEAEERLARHGTNIIPQGPRKSAARRFIAQFNNILIFILIGAGFITAFLHHWIDFTVIATVILINALIGFIQEGKAENALAGIRNLLSPTALVLREGRQVRIDAAQLVPGDLVMLAAGDKVPADIRLTLANSLRVQEAALTGESMDTEKNAGSSACDERDCTAYSGTLVTHGSARGIVTATGKDTEIGRISRSLAEVAPPETPLTRRLARIFSVIAALIVATAISAFAFGIYVRNLPMDDMFMVMIGIAVAAVPEGLPAAISIILAIGARLMAKRHAIVRHLPVIETLGNTTVICTDKTGTLTHNELAVTHVITSAATFTVSGVGYTPDGKFFHEGQEITLADYPAARAILRGALLNNDASLQHAAGEWVLHGDPTEGALMSFALKAGEQREETEAAFPRCAEIPFSPEERYMATAHVHGDGGVIYVKGAPERLLSMCRLQMGVSGATEGINTAYWNKKVEMLAQKGERVLALAQKRIDSAPAALSPADVESGLVLLGIFGITDRPRAEAAEAIALCLGAGIAVKMITGDHALTAAAIAREIGIPGGGAVLTGADIDLLSDDALGNRVAAVNVYARMFPQHKLRLVKALQQAGHVVAMTGDGVNDAPALKAADVGIAMGRKGTEVAKDAAKLVLADDNFASIAAAVEEGRNIFRNLRYTLQFMMVTDFCEGLSLLLSLLAGISLPISPLQILWVNTVTSVTLSMAFAFAPHHKDAMGVPPGRPEAPVFTLRKTISMACHVLVMTLGTIGMFAWGTSFIGDEGAGRTIAVNALIGFQVWYLWGLFPARTERSAGFWRHYLPVVVATVLTVLLQIAFCYTPWMQAIFGTIPLDGTIWLSIIAATALMFFWLKSEKALGLRLRIQPGQSNGAGGGT